MANTLEEQVKTAHDEWLNCWIDITSVTMDWQDCRLLLECYEKYTTLLKEYEDEKAKQSVQNALSSPQSEDNQEEPEIN